MSEVKITGLAELDKLLKALPGKVEKNILRGAMRAGAKVFQDRARGLAPVASGKLRESIRVSTRAKQGQVWATVTAGGKRAFYAPMVEFGTARHFIKPKHRQSLFVAGLARETVDHPGARPNPFMRPALDGGQAEAIGAAADYIRARLDKEAAKA